MLLCSPCTPTLGMQERGCWWGHGVPTANTCGFVWGLESYGGASPPDVLGAGALACDHTIRLRGPAQLGRTALAGNLLSQCTSWSGSRLCNGIFCLCLARSIVTAWNGHAGQVGCVTNGARSKQGEVQALSLKADLISNSHVFSLILFSPFFHVIYFFFPAPFPTGCLSSPGCFGRCISIGIIVPASG